MPDTHNDVVKIYEGTSLTAKAQIPEADVPFVEEVTFRFVQDGEQFEEKTVPVTSGGDDEDADSSGSEGEDADSSGSDDAGAEDGEGEDEDDSGSSTNDDGSTVVSHRVEAPAVPDDKDSYFLEYHFFYKVKKADGTTVPHQHLAVRRAEVFPRTAQLKVTWDKDDEPFLDFPFKVSQNGVERRMIRTFLHDTVNALGDTVPAGTAEFNLDLHTGFRIVQVAPFEITEEVVGAGRKREVKGDLKFRAVFVAPDKGMSRPYVNYDVENQGQTGLGHEITIEVGVHPDDEPFLKALGSAEVHFRVTYGPDAEEPVAKSERDDADHPTKVVKVTESDETATIEEKEANKLYEGKVTLTEGTGKFIVGLGKAGGDLCTVEIAGSDKFLTDETLSPDAALQFENWRRVHYELMVPDLMQDQLDASSLDFTGEAQRLLHKLGRQLFIQFAHDTTHVFDTVAHADYGTLAPKRFLGQTDDAEGVAYVLSGRNWRTLPDEQTWAEAHPGKTLYIALCDRMLKWRQDTEDEGAGTKDFSGTLTEAQGMINVEEKFEGLFMPFSGHDAGDGIAGVVWTADISKDDEACKYTPELTIEEDRYDEVVATGLSVTLEPDEALPTLPERVLFKRPPYPGFELVDETTWAEADEEDDGKVTLKEPTLGKELVLEFEVPEDEEDDEGADDDEEADDEETDDDEEDDEGADDEGTDDDEEDDGDDGGSFSDWGPVPGKDDDDWALADEVPAVTADHNSQLDAFFEELFTDGKDQLGGEDGTNTFTIEIHGNTSSDHRSKRIAQVRQAVEVAYDRTHGHDMHTFASDLADTDTERIQEFVDALLSDPAALGAVQAKVVVHLRCPTGADHGEDDCLTAVKDKLQELFDATAEEFSFHPGLDPDNEFEPRTDTCPLPEITNVQKSTVDEWHFELPAVLSDGRPGPGTFVGEEKTAEQCPVTFELSFQAHEASPGEADGKLLAWACGETDAAKHLISLILQGFQGSEDEACLAHGHGDDGPPGECLLDGETLCEDCIAHGRSKNLTVI